MSIDSMPHALPSQRPSWVPPLQSGDRLTRAEFERRYEAMPENVKAELIEGVVYIMSVSVSIVYPRFTPREGHDVDGRRTPAKRRGPRQATIPRCGSMKTTSRKPDGLLRIEEACGGQSRIVKHGYLEGAAELMAEISASSASYDLHDKRNAYRRNKVLEYVVWRVVDQAIDWFVWRERHCRRLSPDANGWYKSEVFPGLWLDPAALLAGDMAKVLAVLQQGLSSPEHAAFVAKLESVRRQAK